MEYQYFQNRRHHSASLDDPGYMWQAISGALRLNKQPLDACCGLDHLQLHSLPHQAKNVQYMWLPGSMKPAATVCLALALAWHGTAWPCMVKGSMSHPC